MKLQKNLLVIFLLVLMIVIGNCYDNDDIDDEDNDNNYDNNTDENNDIEVSNDSNNNEVDDEDDDSNNNNNERPNEYFSALAHMEQLLETEIKIAERLDRYLDHEERRIALLREISNNYRILHSIASKDVGSYLSNPINAFILVKRLTNDWKWVESYVNTDQRNLNDFLEYNETFPSPDDLQGAAEAMHRLQVTYKLDTTMMADGIIPQKYIRDVETTNSSGLTTNSVLNIPLTANDCFEVGRQAYTTEDFQHTYLWMKEAWKRVKTEQFLDYDKHSIEQIEILEYLAYSAYKLNSIQEAYNLTVHLLQLDSEHKRGLLNLEYFGSLLLSDNQSANQEKQREENQDSDLQQLSNSENTEIDDRSNESTNQKYESLCRGDNRMKESVRSKLVCFYLDTRKLDPYIRLSRFKVEEAYHKPQILVIYNVISDSEVEYIKSLSTPHLKRATVFSPKETMVTKSRVSKSAWFSDGNDSIVNKISMRIQAITGLEMKTAEHLQVVNYGIGGHYQPHFDYTTVGDSQHDKFEFGNRLATWINYMSDVTAGGATVFPYIDVTVWPKKNSAAFWYNLLSDGEGDELTMHAACPVLVGTKWISNKWIHEKGQELRKQCFKGDQYNYLQKKV